MTWVYVGLAVVLVVALWFLRGKRAESGMTSYRRHIDALSSESRRGVREVNDRSRNSNRRDDTGRNETGS